MSHKLESSFDVNSLFEISIDVNGFSYLVIMGHHINGYYICIPNYNIGTEAGDPSSVGFNTDKLIEAGLSSEVARDIAEEISEYVKTYM